MDARNVFMYDTFLVIFVLVIAGHAETSTVIERMETRCRQYAENVFEIVEDPVLLPGALPKRQDVCRISSQPTIVGGENAGPQEFPHMALIGYGRRQKIEWRCGGSLISERWVVSAAHCVKTPNLAKFVLLGDLDFESTEDDDNYDASPEIYGIVSWVIHPNYKEPQVYNDIALFKLNATVEFSRFIRPICLHAPVPEKNTSVLASGWGATSYGGTSSSMLLKAGLDVIGNDECRRMYPVSSTGVTRILKDGISEETQLCARRVGKDTCQGDSGGPLQQLLSDPYCMYSIIGVTSIGNKCGAKLAGVFTRIDHYLPWIESAVWPQKNASAAPLAQVPASPTLEPQAPASPTFQPQPPAFNAFQPLAPASPSFQPQPPAFPTLHPQAPAFPTLQPHANATSTIRTEMEKSTTLSFNETKNKNKNTQSNRARLVFSD